MTIGVQMPVRGKPVPAYITNIIQRLEEGPLDNRLAEDAAAALRALLQVVAPPRLEVDPNTNTARRRGREIKLSPSQTCLVYRLAKTYPEPVPADKLHIAVWGAHQQRHVNTLRATICEARHKLAPLGVAIESVYGNGYRLLLSGEDI